MSGLVSLENISDYDLGYLIGVYCGDGSSTSGDHYMFRINAGLDREMAERSSEILEKLGIKHRFYQEIEKYWRIYVTAWSESEYLVKSLELQIDNFQDWFRNQKIGFLAGFYDAEAHLKKRGGPSRNFSIQYSIEIADTHLYYLMIFSYILNEFGFAHSFKPKSPNKYYPNSVPQYRIFMSTKSKIQDFLSLVNPAIPRKSSLEVTI